MKVFQKDSAMDRHVVDPLFGLMFHHVEEMLARMSSMLPPNSSNI